MHMPALNHAAPDGDAAHSNDVVLVLHGGGSLGAFECGAYRVIAEWLRTTDSRLVAVAGASIGAINAGVIARNWNNGDAGAGALERLWQELMVPPLPFFANPQPYWQRWNGLLTGLITGNPRLYTPNHAGWNLLGAALRFQMPFHRTQSMESTIERHVGNYPVADPGRPLLLIRAMNVETGAAEIFHSARNVITPRHLRASAAIPLLFDPIEIDGQWYWDGDMGPRSLMADALAAIEDDRLLEGTGPLLVIVVDTMPRAGRRPLTELESSYRLEGLVFGGRSDSDQRWVELGNHHLRFVEELEKHAAGLPHESPVRGAIERERVTLRRAGKRSVTLLRIDRKELEHDHVSRSFDYSPDRLNRLITQGMESAKAAVLSSPFTKSKMDYPTSSTV